MFKMSSISRYKNRGIARLVTRFPSLSRRMTKAFTPIETRGVPWTPVNKALARCRVALVSTAGIHHRDQPPFDMNDPEGDPSFRAIDISRPGADLMITHDYYDHSDADRDINIVFPLRRLLELEQDGTIGEVAGTHYGFMGHILGGHVRTLLTETAPEVARRLTAEAVDAVLLIPG
jgi:D-proline reductase (dithiol) PrdB